jgi:hypothetical protein
LPHSGSNFNLKNQHPKQLKYNPLIHKLHDMIVGCGLPVVYLIFLIALKWKMRGAVSGLGINRLQLMVITDY